MYLIWGDVPVRVNRLLGFEAEAVFDPTGCDYLWTDYTVSIEGLWGRQADGYTFAAMTPEGPMPAFLPGFIAAAAASGTRSVVATRHALSQRAPFVFYEINQLSGQADILLASGGIDAANGPVMVEPPVVLSTHGQGNLTFVRCTFRVSVCDCPLVFTPELVAGRRQVGVGANAPQVIRRTVGTNLIQPDAPLGQPETDTARAQRRASEFVNVSPIDPPLVGDGLGLLKVGEITVCRSNRWTTSVSADPATESPVYRFVGQAIFRRDVLQQIGAASVDQFRGSLLPTMPLNCTREINDLSVSGDGLTLTYDVTDRMQVRGYLDHQVTPLANGRAMLRGGAPYARNVASVKVNSFRQYDQPGMSRAMFQLIDHLSTVNFANPVEGPVGGENIVPGAAEGKRVARQLFNLGVAVAKTVNDSILPTATEGAVAEVQITREGSLADAQALAFALVNGVLLKQNMPQIVAGGGDAPGQAQPNPGVVDILLNAARFYVFPPATTLRVDCDHKEGVVRVTKQTEESGLADFVFGGTMSVAAQMLRPFKDEVVGGRETMGIFNLAQLMDVVGDVGMGPFAAILKQPGFGAKSLDATAVNRFAEQLLITDADVTLRGPNGDGFSRAACDLLVRSAQVLLRPCQTPLAAANRELGPLPQMFVSEQSGDETRPGVGPNPGDPLLGLVGGTGAVSFPPSGANPPPNEFPKP